MVLRLPFVEFLAHCFVVLDDGQKVDQVHYFAHPFVEVVQIHIVFEVGARDLAPEVSGDPGMQQGLVHRVPLARLRMAQLLNKPLRKSIESSAIFELGEAQDFLPVGLLVFSAHPERMLRGYELKHDESDGPDVDSLAVDLASCHLLRCLVDHRAALVVDALPCLVFDGQAEVHKLAGRIVVAVGEHDVRRLQVPVHIVALVDVAESQEYPFDELCAISVLQVLPLLHLAFPELAHGAACRVLDAHDHIVGELLDLNKIMNNKE